MKATRGMNSMITANSLPTNILSTTDQNPEAVVDAIYKAAISLHSLEGKLKMKAVECIQEITVPFALPNEIQAVISSTFKCLFSYHQHPCIDVLAKHNYIRIGIVEFLEKTGTSISELAYFHNPSISQNVPSERVALERMANPNNLNQMPDEIDLSVVPDRIVKTMEYMTLPASRAYCSFPVNFYPSNEHGFECAFCNKQSFFINDKNESEGYCVVEKKIYMLSDITHTIQERGSRYGNFKEQSEIVEGLVKYFTNKYHDKIRQMSDYQIHALYMILTKISRVIGGDPNYPDNWHDIEGYARLVFQELTKESQENIK